MRGVDVCVPPYVFGNYAGDDFGLQLVEEVLVNLTMVK